MAHRWMAERAQPGDIVIDATSGGGVDTLALARLVGERGSVFAFDIQQAALDRTRERLDAIRAGGKEKLADTQLLLQSHEQMADCVPAALHGHIAGVMFNLGFLPGGDESLITQPSTTIAALEAALALLRPGGVITCVVYPGHPGGAEEAQAVQQWVEALPDEAAATMLYRQLHKKAAPYLLGLEKKGK